MKQVTRLAAYLKPFRAKRARLGTPIFEQWSLRGNLWPLMLYGRGSCPWHEPRTRRAAQSEAEDPCRRRDSENRSHSQYHHSKALVLYPANHSSASWEPSSLSYWTLQKPMLSTLSPWSTPISSHLRTIRSSLQGLAASSTCSSTPLVTLRTSLLQGLESPQPTGHSQFWRTCRRSHAYRCIWLLHTRIRANTPAPAPNTQLPIDTALRLHRSLLLCRLANARTTLTHCAGPWISKVPFQLREDLISLA